MLKKTAYVVITSGLFLAPLGASAMVGDSPFPACVGPDCAIVSHDDVQRDAVAALSESARKTSGRTDTLAAQKLTSNNPFPEDTSKD
jgi:uncharacterized protein YbjT (DUF2867 family)